VIVTPPMQQDGFLLYSCLPFRNEPFDSSNPFSPRTETYINGQLCRVSVLPAVWTEDAFFFLRLPPPLGRLLLFVLDDGEPSFAGRSILHLFFPPDDMSDFRRDRHW